VISSAAVPRGQSVLHTSGSRRVACCLPLKVIHVCYLLTIAFNLWACSNNHCTALGVNLLVKNMKKRQTTKLQAIVQDGDLQGWRSGRFKGTYQSNPFRTVSPWQYSQYALNPGSRHDGAKKFMKAVSLNVGPVQTSCDEWQVDYSRQVKWLVAIDYCISPRATQKEMAGFNSMRRRL
jgi:hypothetical protein